MTDYIKREDAIIELRKRVHRFTVADEIGYTGTVKWSEEVIYETSAMNGLMSVPATDVVERKRGKWIEFPAALAYKDAYCDTHIVCSACEAVFDIMDNCTETFNYCPNCGARMVSDENK